MWLVFGGMVDLTNSTVSATFTIFKFRECPTMCEITSQRRTDMYLYILIYIFMGMVIIGALDAYDLRSGRSPYAGPLIFPLFLVWAWPFVVIVYVYVKVKED